MEEIEITYGITLKKDGDYFNFIIPEEHVTEEDIEEFKRYFTVWHTKKSIKNKGEVLVLIVDDFAATRSAVKKILVDGLKFTKLDYIREANNGNAALDLLKIDPKCDLIISDWNMPEMSGLELLIETRERPELKDIPFLMVTSEGSGRHVKEAIKAGVSNYLIKPFTSDTLKKKLQMMKFII